MADTVVHEQVSGGNNNMVMGLILGVILVIAVIALVFFFGFGRNFGTWGSGNATPQVNIPVPDKIDVNVKGQ